LNYINREGYVLTGKKISHSDLLELRRWNTPAVYNGWEAISKRDRLECGRSLEPIVDYAPQMGPMAGYAVTCEYTASSKEVASNNPDGYLNLYKYLASIPGPKILIAKSLDSPDNVGSILGEVTGNACRALDCVGAIDDGWVRDVDEAAYGGFKILGRCLGVSHGYCTPLKFGNEVEIFGAKVKPGMLVHADKYGFIAIPEEETPLLLEAVRFMDGNECRTMIHTARESQGKSAGEIVESYAAALAEMKRNGAEFRKKMLG
jgi:regulator of RNase E activity RraA